jgi:hypothetical protein
MHFRKNPLTIIIVLSLFLSSCEFQCSIGGNKDEKKLSPGAVMKDGAALYNDVNLSATGVKVNRAFLTNAKNEKIQPGNFVAPNEKVFLNIIVDSGWVATDGRCYLGASEKVVTHQGNELLNEADLFSSMDETGASDKDAKIISLSVLLKLPENAPPNNFHVSFRVWDKKGTGEITGDYKLYTK